MPSIITLQETKLHLRVTASDEDTLIQTHINAANSYIRNYLNGPVPGIANVPTNVPSDIKAAALLFVTNLYENRGQSADPSTSVNNQAINSLLHFYRTNIGI